MELEKAARNGDVDIIKVLHPVFAQRWLSYYEPLGEVVSVDDNLKIAAEHMDEISEIFAQIRYGAENMDVDVLDEMSKMLDEYRFESPLAEKIEVIKMHILNFEVEKLTDIEI